MGEAINLVENYKAEIVIFNCGEFNGLEKELIEKYKLQNMVFLFIYINYIVM